jgi:hypothetical protein
MGFLNGGEHSEEITFGHIAGEILLVLYFFMFMQLSQLLLGEPVFGGALFTASGFWQMYYQLYRKKSLPWLPDKIQRRRTLFFICALLNSLALVLLYPYGQDTWDIVGIIGCALLLALRSILERFISEKEHQSAGLRNGLILGLHAGVLAGVFFLLRRRLSGGMLWLALAVSALGGFLKLPFQWTWFGGKGGEEQPYREYSAKMLEVSSYAIYRRTVMQTTTALYLSVMLYACWIWLLPGGGLWSNMLLFFYGAGIVALVAGLFYGSFRKRAMEAYQRNTLFTLGCLCWMGSYLIQILGADSEGNLYFYLSGALLGLGLAIVVAVLICMNAQMKQVVELGLGRLDEKVYRQNLQLALELAVLVACLIMLLVLTVVGFVMHGKWENLQQMLRMSEFWQTFFVMVPMIFLIVALLSGIVQPLSGHYAAQLGEYERIRRRGGENRPMQRRLVSVLVHRYPRRLGIRFLRFLLRPVLYHKVYGKEKVDLSDGPVVFVANHGEVYGPVVTNIYLPFYFRPWIIEEMVNRDRVTRHIYQGTFRHIRWLPRRWRYPIAHLVSPILVWLLRSAEPIPVYRGSGREVLGTIRMSVEALEAGDNLLLFPENPQEGENERYATQGVSGFFTGFAHLGKAYYAKTGRLLAFYPVYADKHGRTLCIGDCVRYEAGHAAREEKLRIARELESRMNSMGEAAKQPDGE